MIHFCHPPTRDKRSIKKSTKPVRTNRHFCFLIFFLKKGAETGTFVCIKRTLINYLFLSRLAWLGVIVAVAVVVHCNIAADASTWFGSDGQEESIWFFYAGE